MSFFENRAINRANFHSAIQAFASGAGGIFIFVFLLKAGVPTPLVLCTISAMTAGRFVLRSLVLPIARRIGLRRVLMLGTVLEAAVFPLLPMVHGPGAMLLVVIVVSSIGSVLYWTCFHAFFAALGDADHRGHQVGVREAVNGLINIIAPVVGGWLLVTAGPVTAFWLVAAIQILAAVPLLGAPDVPVEQDAPGGDRERRYAAILQSTDGMFSACFYYLWQIALFVSLGEHFAVFGGVAALAGIVGAVGSLAMGRMIDFGQARHSVSIGYGLAAAVVVARALSVGHPALAALANALGALVISITTPVMMTRVYNLSKASPCTLRFHIATEAGWDLGCCFGCLIAAALLAFGLPFTVPILVGLAAVAGSWILLRSGPAGPMPNRT